MTKTITINDAIDILKKAQKVIEARGDKYSGMKVFEDVADLWSAYLSVSIPVESVAAMMILLKIARLKNAAVDEDSIIDICGYGALLGEMQ